MANFDFVFLFEHTGYAAEPFTKRGFRTLIVDIKNIGLNPKATETWNWNILERELDLIEIVRGARFVFGMPPCDDLAVSGARHFQAKYEKDASFQSKAAQLFMTTMRIANIANIPYGIENPGSVMSTLWRKPSVIFNPYEFGGYLPENDIHPEYPRYIAPRDAYPKKTCWWTGNGFRFPVRKPVVVADGYSLQHKLLGGKSEKTKRIRSASPRGVFEALAQEYCNVL